MLKTSKDEEILDFALRTVGNVTGGTVNEQTDSQTDTLLQMGLLDTFPRLLRHSKNDIVEVSLLLFFLFFLPLSRAPLGHFQIFVPAQKPKLIKSWNRKV